MSSVLDLTNASFEDYAVSETGEYYKVKTEEQKWGGEQVFVVKVYRWDRSRTVLIASQWRHVNQYVAETIPLIQTTEKDGRMGLVFPYRSSKMYEWMERKKHEMDSAMQLPHCISLARTLFDLHTRAQCVHTRLHPKYFYRDSDGKFKLGHLSKLLQFHGNSSDFEALKAQERYRAGLLMIYIMTNTPFDRLVNDTKEYALGVYDTCELTGIYASLRVTIDRLLQPNISSNDDFDSIISLSNYIIPKTIPQFSSQIHQNSTLPTHPKCTICHKSTPMNSIYSMNLPGCGHYGCVSCVYNLCIRKGEARCQMCMRRVDVERVMIDFPHEILRKELEDFLANQTE